MPLPSPRLKVIEHYRHALRSKPSPHINAMGVRIARKIGNDLSAYHLVVTSPKKRAVETAVAMGFAVEETTDALKDVPLEVNERIPYDRGFGPFAELIPRDPVVQAYVRKLRDFHLRLLEQLPEGGRALLVSHGGVVEWSALSVFEKAAKWGKAVDKCEGVRLVFENTKCIDGAPLRLPQI